ncbi:hypothetical protein BZG36_03330 [Bifiguratus adelaidae]|uniref:Uncharacterized protein n=1 Tax=Bifiguratus adelaidae TaxID=1938954 RepID=A0A261XXU6_9FUNG|nr:hypothetical protein BZG36_03330 [Bifiguratus adelaidae]
MPQAAHRRAAQLTEDNLDEHTRGEHTEYWGKQYFMERFFDSLPVDNAFTSSSRTLSDSELRTQADTAVHDSPCSQEQRKKRHIPSIEASDRVAKKHRSAKDVVTVGQESTNGTLNASQMQEERLSMRSFAPSNSILRPHQGPVSLNDTQQKKRGIAPGKRSNARLDLALKLASRQKPKVPRQASAAYSDASTQTEQKYLRPEPRNETQTEFTPKKTRNEKLPKVSSERVTIQPEKRVGLYNKGKVSLRVNTRGSSGVAFSAASFPARPETRDEKTGKDPQRRAPVLDQSKYFHADNTVTNGAIMAAQHSSDDHDLLRDDGSTSLERGDGGQHKNKNMEASPNDNEKLRSQAVIDLTESDEEDSVITNAKRPISVDHQQSPEASNQAPETDCSPAKSLDTLGQLDELLVELGQHTATGPIATSHRQNMTENYMESLMSDTGAWNLVDLLRTDDLVEHDVPLTKDTNEGDMADNHMDDLMKDTGVRTLDDVLQMNVGATSISTGYTPLTYPVDINDRRFNSADSLRYAGRLHPIFNSALHGNYDFRCAVSDAGSQLTPSDIFLVDSSPHLPADFWRKRRN